MTYENALEKIHSLLSFGSRPGLDRILTLLDRMGNPQNKLKYIHVAGTNGKGSTCAMLSSTLVAAGYKTGLFISPYINDFRERIQINNEMISKEMLANAVEETFPLIEKLQSEGIIITEFEYVNALEFYIHANENCDVVVLETGMGGLLDCTNVIKPPLCSVITTIGLDHTAILGDTIEKISAQKCGIIKSGSIAVTSKQTENAMKVIEQTAERLNVPLMKSESVNINVTSETLEGSEFEYNGRKIHINLAGKHQLENAKTAIAAIESVRQRGLLEISDDDISEGFAKAVNPARFELLSKNPVVILDGAHNPNGIEALKNSVRKFLDGEKITCVMGMLADKDIDSSIKLLDGVFETVYTVPVDNPRAISSEELAEKCKGYFKNITSFDSAEKAFDGAFENAEKNGGAVIVCGSLYLAGEIRPYILDKVQ
ncbi:folylpolyglutamate synthase/dihydrofolate synthase family protein [uncultured Ruminococcus sp.]|uniref:bifunctional folylpolyglutamate synthase/dihydrofolate synthase n=1 Tax=uncultured Ruminococcus sp. TaxID=165186 RepID=UPI0025E90F0D|nr:folylpolyglutamate synthase/dihydrofolate synthase family protein [uncultured Ruminococcus sp.]